MIRQERIQRSDLPDIPSLCLLSGDPVYPGGKNILLGISEDMGEPCFQILRIQSISTTCTDLVHARTVTALNIVPLGNRELRVWQGGEMWCARFCTY